MNCKACGIYDNDGYDEDYFTHQQSLRHQFNTQLYFYNNHRSRFLSEGAKDVEVVVSLAGHPDILNFAYNDPRIKIKTTLNGLERCRYIDCNFTIKNISNCFITLTRVNFLHPIEIFHYHDVAGYTNKGRFPRLEPGATYCFRLRFYLENFVIGNFLNIFSLTLQKDNDRKVFYINRECFIEISDEVDEVASQSKSPFKSKEWHCSTVVPCTKKIGDYCLKYPIPADYETVLSMLRNNINLGPYHQFCQTIRYRLQRLTQGNYVDYFHALLYLDEVEETMNLKRYNMENVSVKIISECIFELMVPGLSEKRPSLIAGDLIILRVHKAKIAYEGVITRIRDEAIWIQKMDENFMMSFEHAESFMADVKFKISRLSYVRKHEAIDNCKHMMHVLFPAMRIHSSSPHLLNRGDFFNEFIGGNEQQQVTISNILNDNTCSTPYMVYGPPGTGKTVTIVEAILQIKKRTPNAKILICAPSNAACDNIALKLSKYCNQNKKEIIRIQAENIDWRLIPQELLPYCNIINGSYVSIQYKDINKYKIIITTLILCGKYRGYYKPDYVFIDEAAQASEPECLIPISLMQTKGKVILCGDPKQLGPITYCKGLTLKNLLSSPSYLDNIEGEKFGLGISLLERLYDSGVYEYCTCFTMLIQNFRSHKSLLTIPNKLFYEDKLKPMSIEAQNDPITRIPFYSFAFPNNRRRPRDGMYAMEFCSIFGQEKKEGSSPSYFNLKEIQAVMKYVKALLDHNVKETDIGIIAPYIRQVCKIRMRLEQQNLRQIEVGSTEAFQGREKRVIIISTVRAKDDLLLYDKKYRLGFVECARRFNVAITRAKTKLIIIGNPNILQYANNFKMLIKECIRMNSYYGAGFVERDDDLMHEIMRRMEGMDQSY